MVYGTEKGSSNRGLEWSDEWSYGGDGYKGKNGGKGGWKGEPVGR